MNQRIVIAEFDQNTAYGLKSHLESAGFQVLSANDGETAWNLIWTRVPGVVILGASLPRLTSREIVRRIRSVGEMVDLPIVIVGDELPQRELVDWFKLEIDDYVEKSISSQLLVAKIRALMRRIYREKKD